LGRGVFAAKEVETTTPRVERSGGAPDAGACMYALHCGLDHSLLFRFCQEHRQDRIRIDHM
jgi:hypothetical protein